MRFTTENFWIHFHNLPLGYMNAKMDKQIGDTIGIFNDCEVQDDGNSWGTVLRVLLEIELQKPTTRERTINVQGKKLWIPFTYEKLPWLCFGCGRISHGNGICDAKDPSARGSNGNMGPSCMQDEVDALIALRPTRLPHRNSQATLQSLYLVDATTAMSHHHKWEEIEATTPLETSENLTNRMSIASFFLAKTQKTF